MAGREQLKTYFQTGDKPTQSQFYALIDSIFNLQDDAITIASINGLANVLAGKAGSDQVVALNTRVTALEQGKIALIVTNTDAPLMTSYNSATYTLTLTPTQRFWDAVVTLKPGVRFYKKLSANQDQYRSDIFANITNDGTKITLITFEGVDADMAAGFQIIFKN